MGSADQKFFDSWFYGIVQILFVCLYNCCKYSVCVSCNLLVWLHCEPSEEKSTRGSSLRFVYHLPLCVSSTPLLLQFFVSTFYMFHYSTHRPAYCLPKNEMLWYSSTMFPLHCVMIVTTWFYSTRAGGSELPQRYGLSPRLAAGLHDVRVSAREFA